MQEQESLPKSVPPAGTPRVDPDPVGLSHSAPIELPTADELKLKQAVRRAKESGRYVVAVFAIGTEPEKETGRLPLTCDAFRFGKFPKGDFNECVRLLAESLTSMEGG